MNWTIYFIFCGSFGVHKYFFYCWKAIVFVNDWSKQKRTKGTQTATTKTTTTLKRAKIFSLLEKKRAKLEVPSEVKQVLIQCWSTFFVSLLFIVHCLVDFSGCWITKSQPKFVATLSTQGKTHLFVQARAYYSKTKFNFEFSNIFINACAKSNVNATGK